MLLGFQTGPSTFLFCFFYFEFILKTNNINVNSTKKINNYKNNALKIEHVQNTFENLNIFENLILLRRR